MNKLLYLSLGLFWSWSSSYAFVLVEAPRLNELMGHHSGNAFTYDKKELQEFHDSSVGDFLQRSSSFYVSKQGAPGSSASVFMRGQEASSLAVYIDGVLVNDPTNPSRSFDFGHLSMAQVQSIRIFQGPQTVLHGGSAQGGVIHITTLDSSAQRGGRASYQLERYETHDASLSYTGQRAQTSWALGLNHKKSEGFSSASSSNRRAPTPDGREFNQAQLSLKKNGLQIKGRYQKDQFDLDGFDQESSLPTDTPNDSGEDEQWQLSTQWDEQLSAKLWADYQLAFKKTQRQTWQDETKSRFEGSSWQLKLEHQWQQNSNWSAFFGLHGFLEQVQQPLNRSRRSGGLYWLQHYENSGLIASLGARLERHQSFEEAHAFSLSLGRKVSPHSSLKYNLSTAFRTPSLSELFDPTYGNPNLGPETSQHHELSWQYSNRKKQLKLHSGLFTTRTRSRISFDNQSLKSLNKGSAAIYGIEFKTSWQAHEYVPRVSAEATLLKAYDLETGADLSRRPRQKWGLNLQQKISPALTLNADLNWVSSRLEFNGETLAQYTQVDLHLKYADLKGLELWSGLENIFDEPNRGALGYTSPGVVWSFGLAQSF